MIFKQPRQPTPQRQRFLETAIAFLFTTGCLWTGMGLLILALVLVYAVMHYLHVRG